MTTFTIVWFVLCLISSWIGRSKRWNVTKFDCVMWLFVGVILLPLFSYIQYEVNRVTKSG